MNTNTNSTSSDQVLSMSPSPANPLSSTVHSPHSSLESLNFALSTAAEAQHTLHVRMRDSAEAANASESASTYNATMRHTTTLHGGNTCCAQDRNNAVSSCSQTRIKIRSPGAQKWNNLSAFLIMLRGRQAHGDSTTVTVCVGDSICSSCEREFIAWQMKVPQRRATKFKTTWLPLQRLTARKSTVPAPASPAAQPVNTSVASTWTGNSGTYMA
jgi:hypothetical protein